MTYSFTPQNMSKSCQAKASYLRTHFKNMHETAMAVKGMKIDKALQYLTEVVGHTRCIPFLRFNGSMGRTGQAKEFGTDKGRWPVKSIKFLEQLLLNAKANAVAKGLDTQACVVKHVQVNQAPKIRRRTYRAHGRITPYMSSPCHVEVVLCEQQQDVPREKSAFKSAKKTAMGVKRAARNA